MAEIMAFTSTNCFHVTDDAKLNEIFGNIYWLGDGFPWLSTTDEGYRITCNGSIGGLYTDTKGQYDFEDAVYEAFQKIVPPGEAIVFTEFDIANGNPTDTNALGTIITTEGIDYISIRNEAERRAQRLTGNYNLTVS